MNRSEIKQEIKRLKTLLHSMIEEEDTKKRIRFMDKFTSKKECGHSGVTSIVETDDKIHFKCHLCGTTWKEEK